MSDLIIVNWFKNPEKNIDINIESLNKELKNNKLIIFNNDDEISENNNIDINNNYFINCVSNEKVDSKTENLIFKNIKIDVSKSNIQFKSLKSLSLKNSLIFFSTKTNFCGFENIDNIIIKGDLDNIKKNLSNLKDNNILKNIKQITLKMIPKSSKVNIFKLLNSLNIYLSEIKTSLNIHFKGVLSNLEKNSKESLNNEINTKIKKLFLYSLNKLNKETCEIIKENLIDKLTNLEELYLNENIECNLDNKLKLISIIDNCDEININFNLYDINKLNKINLSICEYNKNKQNLILYGEANMSFYNDNNKQLLLNIINNNHKGKLNLLSLCNFDLENIDYLNDILNKAINNVKKIEFKNLNINQEFIDIIKSKNIFNSEKILIENIIFNDEEIENNFYSLINNYNLCKTLKLISLEDISKYSDIIINDNLENLFLEEIYDINYNNLKEIFLKRKKCFTKLAFKNLEINDDNDKNYFIEIIINNKNDIKKLKILGENFFFIYKEIQDKKIEFNNLLKLILNVDKENNDENDENNFIMNDEDKISYLEKNKNLFNCNNIEKIDLQMFNLNLQKKQKIYKMFNNLKEIC
mgnify:CR=1 FL=1